MAQIRIMGDEDIRNILDIKGTVAFVERAYIMKSTDQARLFPIVSEEIIKGHAEMDIKSGMLEGEGIFGLKAVSWFGDNSKKGLSTITGLSMIFDMEHGFPKALLNAGYMTAMRTGAAGAIGVKYLANPGAEALLMVGTGNQAVFQIAAAISTIRSIKRIYLYNPLSLDGAREFQNGIKMELEKLVEDINDPDRTQWRLRINEVEFVATNDVVMALQQIDAVITATPSREALLRKEWVKPGTHFSCMGADTAGKQEIDETIFNEAVVFVDDINQAISVGEIQTAMRAGILQKKDLREIGHLINGDTTGRLSKQDITVFDSTGMALQDLAVAKYLVDRAQELNLGHLVNI